MNLISEPWIPVRRANGWQGRVEPWRITDFVHGESPIVAVASPRPDFDGALMQFLIGLLQTTCTPKISDEWWDWREKPPTPEVLKERFAGVATTFELEGKYAFMQDAAPADLTNELDIGALLIESPGEQTQEQNKDHFVKRGQVKCLCSSCAAAALFNLQTNAPSGGKGYRTSLRGGGPLTTLVLGATLWETCWLNVLEETQYFAGFDRERRGEADRFPWRAKTRTSEAKPPAGITTTADVHPDQQFWAIPRRIRLTFEKVEGLASCDLCDAKSSLVVKRFVTRNYGVNYNGFEHPLSPHYIKDGEANSVHPQPGGIGYRYWLGLVESSKEGNEERRPSKVIQRFRSAIREDSRLWAFGFDMDNMKARCWYDATVPLLSVPEEQVSLFKALVEKLVVAADWVAGVLRGRVKDALLGKSEARGDLSFVGTHFWSATESVFYEHARRLRNGLAVSQAETLVLDSWRSELRRSALDVFDAYSQAGDFDAVNPRAVAIARNDLSKALSGKKLRDILGLPQSARNTP